MRFRCKGVCTVNTDSVFHEFQLRTCAASARPVVDQIDPPAELLSLVRFLNIVKGSPDSLDNAVS